MSLLGRVSKLAGVVPLSWTRNGPLGEMYGHRKWTRPRPTPRDAVIQRRVAETVALGELPLWQGYGEGEGATRTPGTVSTETHVGRFYADLVQRLQPSVVVEFGSAFGVSGMYWLAGLEAAGDGHLFSFEPNKRWAGVAEANMAAVSGRFTLTADTFEESVDAVLDDRRIDLAFIDAIHTSEFVEPQFEIVASRLSPNGVVVLDDIAFSDDMRGCWERLSRDPRVIAAGTATRRVGLLQLR